MKYLNLILYLSCATIAISISSCNKDDDINGNKHPELSQNTGNAIGTIEFILNSNSHAFNVINITIPDEEKSTQYDLLITGETENEKIEFYLYQNDTGVYICGEQSAKNGTFNIMIVDKDNHSLKANYTSSNECRLDINTFENYRLKKRDKETKKVIFPGSLDLLELSFYGEDDNSRFVDGKINCNLK